MYKTLLCVRCFTVFKVKGVTVVSKCKRHCNVYNVVFLYNASLWCVGLKSGVVCKCKGRGYVSKASLCVCVCVCVCKTWSFVCV